MANFSELTKSLRLIFRSGKTKTIEWRQSQLMSMLKLFDENRDRLCDALKSDLNKSKFESVVFEVDLCRNDLINCLNNLTEWTKPEKVKKGMLNVMDKCYIRREPFGVVLIIGAWNYPVQLTFLPLIGAIAAGNCVVLKPSEIAGNMAATLGELIPKYFDNEAIVCVNGGIPETTALLKEKWDYIFYTGNSVVGKIVMKAAAEHLTPVTLELGGKSPVYVDEGVDYATVANRILWGKCTNAGQTCIAPDYIMCTKLTQDALIEKFQTTLKEFYPDGPAKSPDYCRMISDRNYQRVKKILEGGAKIAIGGDTDDAQRYIAPTVLSDVSFSDPVMMEEIFGPILPIVLVKNEDEAIEHILDGDKPLSMYVFTNNHALAEKMAERCSSGGFLVNDCLMHAGLPTLPFGGVGNSGIGAYHGKYSLETFSHRRSCMERGLKMESVNSIRYPPFTNRKLTAVGFLQGSGKQPQGDGLRYPPFTQKKLSTLNWLMCRKLKSGGIRSMLPYFILGTIFAILIKLFLDA